MKKLKEKLQRYFRESSLWKIVSDIFFLLVLLLLLIPGTRKELLSHTLRAGLRQPSARSLTENPAPAFTGYSWSLSRPDGTELLFEDLEGNVIFLNFWASWCPPCMAEMPSIQKLYNAYGDRVRFVLVSREAPETLRSFLEKNGYSFPVYYQQSREPALFESSTIPASFIISGEGNLVLEKKGAGNWNGEKIRQLLEELLQENRDL